MQTNILLLNIARKYCNKSGLEDIENLLLKEKPESARAYLAGVLEGLWKANKLKQEEAEEAFRCLGLDINELISYGKRKVH